MELSQKSCRICLSESEFNVSLFGSYCRRTNMVDKVLVCLKLVIEEVDTLNTICYKCAENIERYYNFIMSVRKSQMKLADPRPNVESSVNRRHVTSYVREQIFDADYTFSFLETPEEKNEPKQSSPFFSYFSPPRHKVVKKVSNHMWKTPESVEREELRRNEKFREKGRPTHHSRDLFESQSQDVEDPEARSLNWNLTPDDNILKRVRDKCFGRSDF